MFWKMLWEAFYVPVFCLLFTAGHFFSFISSFPLLYCTVLSYKIRYDMVWQEFSTFLMLPSYFNPPTIIFCCHFITLILLLLWVIIQYLCFLLVLGDPCGLRDRLRLPPNISPPKRLFISQSGCDPQVEKYLLYGVCV